MTTTTQPTKTAAERKREERDRRRAEGLVRLELWLHPDDHAQVKKLAALLTHQRARGR